MESKDWLTLLIPVFCNGVVVFFLQKLFEKRQREKSIQHEYYSVLRSRVDSALELHAKATRLANERKPSNDDAIAMIITQFFDSCLDVYYYYIQNKLVFISFEKKCEELANLLVQLSEIVNSSARLDNQASEKINTIRDCLQEIKQISMY